MNKPLIWTVLLAINTLACQQHENARNLVGRWRYDVDSMRRENLATLENRNYFESLIEGFQSAKLDLRSNGTLEFSLDSTRQKGRWRVRRNGQQLELTLSDRPQVSRIERLSKDTLVLTPVGKDPLNFRRVLVLEMEPAGRPSANLGGK